MFNTIVKCLKRNSIKKTYYMNLLTTLRKHLSTSLSVKTTIKESRSEKRLLPKDIIHLIFQLVLGSFHFPTVFIFSIWFNKRQFLFLTCSNIECKMKSFPNWGSSMSVGIFYLYYNITISLLLFGPQKKR